MSIESLLRQIFDSLPAIIKALPFILGWFIIARLAYDRLKAWKAPLNTLEAAQTMVALAAFAYAIR